MPEGDGSLLDILTAFTIEVLVSTRAGGAVCNFCRVQGVQVDAGCRIFLNYRDN